jgi:hypothetical protein
MVSPAAAAGELNRSPAEDPVVPLLDKIKDRVALPSSGKRKTSSLPAPAPPTNESGVAKAELLLGFQLPPLVKTMYLEIGNGGFGPAEGFLPIRVGEAAAGMDLVMVYRDCSGRPGWPPHLLPIVYAGCDVYFCIDCDHLNNRVIMFDGDLGGLEESDVSEPRRKWPYPDSPLGVCFRTRAKSLVEFLIMWLADETQLYRWAQCRRTIRCT